MNKLFNMYVCSLCKFALKVFLFQFLAKYMKLLPLSLYQLKNANISCNKHEIRAILRNVEIWSIQICKTTIKIFIVALENWVKHRKLFEQKVIIIWQPNLYANIQFKYFSKYIPIFYFFVYKLNKIWFQQHANVSSTNIKYEHFL